MKFKGKPNQLCRITKIKPTLVRKMPKSIRFDENGVFETENRYLIKRLSTKFEVIEEEVEDGLQETEEKEEDQEEMTQEEIRQLAKEKKIKSWHVKSIENLKKELEV